MSRADIETQEIYPLGEALELSRLIGCHSIIAWNERSGDDLAKRYSDAIESIHHAMALDLSALICRDQEFDRRLTADDNKETRRRIESVSFLYSGLFLKYKRAYQREREVLNAKRP